MSLNAEAGRSPERSRAWRPALAVAWTILWGVVGFVAYTSRSYEEIFKQLQMNDLPLPSQGVLAMSRFLRTPVGAAAGGLAWAAGLVLLRCGAFDRRPQRKVLLLAGAIVVLLGVYYLGVLSPIAKIGRLLEQQGARPQPSRMACREAGGTPPSGPCRGAFHG